MESGAMCIPVHALVLALWAVRVTPWSQRSCSEKMGGDGRTIRRSAVAQ